MQRAPARVLKGFLRDEPFDMPAVLAYENACGPIRPIKAEKRQPRRVELGVSLLEFVFSAVGARNWAAFDFIRIVAVERAIEAGEEAHARLLVRINSVRQVYHARRGR